MRVINLTLNLKRSVLQAKFDANVQDGDSSKAIFTYREKNGDSQAIRSNLSHLRKIDINEVDAIN